MNEGLRMWNSTGFGVAAGPQGYVSYLNGSQLDYGGGNEAFLGFDYPAEYQHLVHQHWRGFKTPQIYYKVSLYMIYFILMLLSFFGNGLVIWIFSTSKPLRTPSNMLILNLALFDLMMAQNMPHYLINAALGYIYGGELGCDIYSVFGSISGVGASITNASIAYDRYKTISNPIDGRLSYGQIIILITLTWLYAMPFAIMPYTHIWGSYLPEGFLTTCTFDYLSETDETRLFVQMLFIWAYCIPMTVIVTFYAKLFLHVRNHERMLAEQAKKMNVKSLSANADNQNVEMRIAKAAMYIYLLFIFAWTPYAMVALASTLGDRNLVTPLASMYPAVAAKAVSCLDPWVYATSHPKYRLELERRLPWLGVREKHKLPASSSSGGDSERAETGTVASQ